MTQPQWELTQQKAILEERLERTRLRRSGLPAGFLVFLALAFLFFRDEAWEVARGTAAFSWVMVFGVGAIFGLALNEVTARRSLRDLEEKLRRLKASSPPKDLAGPL